MAIKKTTKTPAKKTAVKAKATTAPKATVRKAAAPKSTPAATKAKPSRPAGPREEKLANSALKLIDEAASLLRKGVKTTADVSEKNREAARKRAHGLLTKATSSLGGLLDSGSSALHKAISKL
jgi:hypothetical protein